ncbi:MAG TPA: ABC transporter substrate-binding protein [Solirubrobacteraceae bacterium]|jgi:ABC-type nitrate/sulfonate/bicarbonate transport system substrate-binding protein
MNLKSLAPASRSLAPILCLLALLSLGCGNTGKSPQTGPSSSSPSTAKVTLVLDFVPNAVHAGIYRALAAGYYRRAHIDLKVVQPGATSDPLSLVDAGRAQFGLADGSDVANEIAKGGDAQAVMAVAQRPLGGLIALASAHLRSPAQLQGATVGVTGVPSDLAVLRTEVRHAGGDPGRVRILTVGFDGAQALLAGRLTAFTGFIPADGVQVRSAGHPITAFALDENGGPGYPGLVAFTTRREAGAAPDLVRRFVAATVHGYEDTLRDPRRSLADLLRLNPSLDRRFTAASLAVYLPLFDERGRVPFGTLRAARIAQLSRWMVQNRLIAAPIAPARYGTDVFLPGR